MEPTPQSERPPCEHACGCPAHRTAIRRRDDGPWSALLVVLACAVCPVCLTGYTKLLAIAGAGWDVGLSERGHVAVLLAAVATSVLVSTWRSLRTKPRWPLAAAAAGGALVLLGHFRDLHALEWLGIIVLLAGSLGEQLRPREARNARSPTPAR